MFHILIEKDNILVLYKLKNPGKNDIFHVLKVIKFFQNDTTYNEQQFLLVQESELYKRGMCYIVNNISKIMKLNYYSEVIEHFPEWFY